MSKRLMIIGLDCATPQLVFDKWRDRLPNLKSLMDRGSWGNLRTTSPPITVPAWTAMMTSKDPGQLGFYGFRNRSSHGYDELYFANNDYVNEKRVWNYLSRARKSSLILGVPQTYPPKPLRGAIAASFLTPNKESDYTYPKEVAAELDALADGDYVIDVKDFRTNNKDWLIDQVYVMTERRFKVVRNWITERDWDFFMFVEMGIDRIHHGFWRYMDPEHRLYEPGHKYQNSIRDYYEFVDAQIGKLLEVRPEETAIMVVSDHGARNMVGGICINDWLIDKGYLVLKEPVTEPTKLKPDMIDWPSTRVWAEGGYYSRVFMNVKGREPQGVIPADEYESFRSQLLEEIAAIPDEKGNDIGTVVKRPEEMYREVKNIAPDLFVYFGDLDWRGAGTVGMGSLHIFENDTGPDDANHDWEGIFIFHDPRNEGGGKRIEGLEIYDIAPTVLSMFDVKTPEDMIGKAIDLY